jgi:hypothetical protein
VGAGYVEGTYTTDTPEGGFGTFTAAANSLAPSNPLWSHGLFTLPDNVLLVARNLFSGPLATAQGNRDTVNDKFTFAATNEEWIDWSLTEKTEETIEADEILTDVNGTVTGTPNTSYIILSQIPSSVTSIVTDAGGTPITYVWMTGTQYITFVSDPGEAIVVAYEWRSAEPDPGQVYYFTANYLRPDELYNVPQLVLDRQAGRTLLAPAHPDNHLYVMNELAFDNGVPGVYYTQVKDPDADGIYTNNDFKAAILATEAPTRVTDLIVLSNFGSLSDSLTSVTKMNDPFERRERLLWVGTPAGTVIGDVDTPGSLSYLAKRTLQVYGNSPAHGSRIIVGSTTCSVDLRLDDGSDVEVSLDGSFVAGALACLCASFQDPGQTILRKFLAGFKTVQTYGDLEDPRNRLLGASDIIYITEQGTSVYRVEEDVTVDTFAEDFHLINNMTQKHFVTRVIRKATDSNLISIVVPSAEAGAGLIKGFVAGTLNTIVSRGIVGRYQDASGNERPLDPDKDVVVFRDTADPTLYHFFYAYWLRQTIKRLFGLYSVNTNDFGLARA